MDTNIKAILAIQDKRKEQAREERDRRVAAGWEKLREFDRNKLWGPCGGSRIEWERDDGETIITTRPSSFLFDTDLLSICLTSLSELGLYCDETLTTVMELAQHHNNIINERDMREYSPPTCWWTEEQRRRMTILKRTRGGTYEGQPKAKKTTSISTRLPSDLMEKLLEECSEHDCSKSTLLLSILSDRYSR
jgi:hypothetical protein